MIQMSLLRRTLFGCATLFALMTAPLSSAASDYARTRYPIVLVHGLTGAKAMLGVVNYFYGIPEKLKQYGNDQVYVATISAFAGEDIREPELEKFVTSVLQQTGANKINLIGHSQGGFTVRAYAALHPDRVASLTTIGTPHHGTPVANLIADINNNLGTLLPGVRNAIVWLANAFGWLNGALNGQDLPQDALGALNLMTNDGAQAFARNVSDAGFNPDCKGPRPTSAQGTMSDAKGRMVHWQYPIFSWVGNGAPTSLFRSGNDLLDPSGYGLSASHFALKYLLNAGNNDGVVPVCSAQLGDVIATNYYWSHLDEVNQILGLTPPSDPRMAFVIHANRLKQLGL